MSFHLSNPSKGSCFAVYRHRVGAVVRRGRQSLRRAGLTEPGMAYRLSWADVNSLAAIGLLNIYLAELSLLQKSAFPLAPIFAAKTHPVQVLRRSLDLNQTDFGAKLGVSAMSVSRWEAGTNEPPAECLVRMAKLSHNDEVFWYFLRLVGLSKRDFKNCL